jgi:hypothetical protein
MLQDGQMAKRLVAKDELEDEMVVGMANEASSTRSNPQHLTGTGPSGKMSLLSWNCRGIRFRLGMNKCFIVDGHVKRR